MTTFAPPARSRFSNLWPGERFSRWFLTRLQQRRGTTQLPRRLVYRDIYILPTPFGYAFAFMLVFTALGGLNFNNNLALLLVFTVGTLAQMTTFLAYRNLTGLTVSTLFAEPVFAGQTAHFQLRLHNDEARSRYSVQATFTEHTTGDCKDVPPDDYAHLTLRKNAPQRGWLAAPAFRIETRYPLGLFRAWTWLFPSARCLIYARPQENPPPLPVMGHGTSGISQRGAGDQLHGLRAYQAGDPLKRIAWRSSARHDALLTREMEAPRERSCELDFEQLDGMDLEQRLSLLTAWVLLADEQQLNYSLKLPALELGPASDASHRLACLEALALYDAKSL